MPYADTFYRDNKGAEKGRLARENSQVAESLRADSMELLSLPRELRNDILGYLYTDSTPGYRIWLECHIGSNDSRYRKLPDDPYCYMNASIVDSTIAVEAATIFYSTNYFEFPRDDHNKFTWFLHTDHYHSGVAPKDVITRLYMSRSLQGSMDTFMLPNFASQLRNVVFGRSETLAFSRDAIWSPLLDAKNLRSIEFQLYSPWPESASTPEMLMFKMLEMRGVSTNVRINLVPEKGFGDSRDYSQVYNEPTKDEILAVEDRKPVDVTHWECRNGLWKPSQESGMTEDEGSEEVDSEEEDDESVEDAYCHYGFPDDEEWEAKWRVYLHRLHDRLWT